MEYIFLNSENFIFRGKSFELLALEQVDDLCVHLLIQSEGNASTIALRVDETVINWDTITSVEQFPVYLGVPFLEPE